MHLSAATDPLPLIAFRGVSTRFGPHWANRDISLDVREREIHAVVGENGAGKTTLMKVLYGHLRPDSGEILLRGGEAVFHSPRDAMRAGIGMVHQQLLIFPQLTALENVLAGFGHREGRSGIRRRRQAGEELLHMCRIFGFDLPLDVPAEGLSFARRQQIELLRILYRKSKILILDEPTSLLSPLEVERLLDLLISLRDKGHTVLFISHRLAEVFAVADRISVLRRGRLVGTFDARESTAKEIARLITWEEQPAGGAAPDQTTDEAGERTEPALPPLPSTLLELRRITVADSERGTGLKDFSLSVREGEILGIGAVVGNGERILAQIVAGMLPLERGEIIFDGRSIARMSVAARLKLGLRWLPANPLEEALIPSRPVWENFLLGRQREKPFQSLGWLRLPRAFEWAGEQLKDAEVVYFSLTDPVASLSGGNQQKLVLARVLAGPPRLAVLEQPGRGLDIRAQARLRRRILALNEKGVSFLILSYDLDELLSLSHRIGIVYRGALVATAERSAATRETLGRWMLGIADESEEQPNQPGADADREKT
jgi:general nucleoside transport system ATP-binding protein